jgi:hypothetical protein
MKYENQELSEKTTQELIDELLMPTAEIGVVLLAAILILTVLWGLSGLK